MLIRLSPFLFVLLWSSAFISAKFGLPYAGPFSFLLTRFAIVALLFGGLALAMQRRWPRGALLRNLLLIGVLMHGVYLGGVFFAISRGMPAGLASLIVSTQPILTAALAIWLLGERPTRQQWLGIALGSAGVVTVLWPRLGGDAPLLGVATCLAALLAITFATIWQKRHGGGMDLLTGNAVQAFAALMFYVALVLVWEPYRVDWTAEFSLAIAWLVLPVSLGAVTLLMLMIRRGSAAATTSLFFLVPPTSVFLAWLAFDEKMGATGIAGLAITSVGVWLVNRRAGNRTDRR